jgi:hypothetical protein
VCFFSLSSLSSIWSFSNSEPCRLAHHFTRQFIQFSPSAGCCAGHEGQRKRRTEISCVCTVGGLSREGSGFTAPRPSSQPCGIAQNDACHRAGTPCPGLCFGPFPEALRERYRSSPRSSELVVFRSSPALQIPTIRRSPISRLATRRQVKAWMKRPRPAFFFFLPL